MSNAIKQQQLPGMPEPANILEIISRAASDPNIDVAKTEKLLEMYERISMKNAEVAFNTAMRGCQEEMPKVLRNKQNDHTKSRYADIEQVNQAIVPVYTKHGFSLSFGTADCPMQEHVRITCLVSHSAGYSRSYQADIPLDVAGAKGGATKTGVQGFGSTISYGRRYLTLLVFNITTTNEDSDGNKDGETLSDEQIANIRALMEEVKADEAKFFRYLKIQSLSDVPAKSYAAIVKLLEAKRGRS